MDGDEGVRGVDDGEDECDVREISEEGGWKGKTGG